MGDITTKGNDDSDYFIQIPLDDVGFALIFCGWNYGIDDAPEMVIVVVKGNKAKVVFDNYAISYSYTAPPNFSMEYIDDINNLYVDTTETNITSSYLSTRTKHKIWREGNMLKYKSWK